MFTTHRLIGSSLMVLCLFSVLIAQEEKRVTNRGTAPTVTASASSERVRFAAPGSTVQMQLEVFANGGEKIFDSTQSGNVLDWVVQDQAGQRLPDGTYFCVVRVKSLSGKVSQKLGTLVVQEKQLAVQPIDSAQLTPAMSESLAASKEAPSIDPLEGYTALTVVGEGEPEAVTTMAHDGTRGVIDRSRGALSFRVGDFFSGNDKEQMRLTEDGNLGIGTTKPTAKLDVAGTIRAREGFIFSDGSMLKLNEKGVLTRTNADGLAPSSVTTTQDKIAKFTDNAGTVGDSVMTELAGNIGLGTATPTQALDVANGRIVTTGSQTLTSILDSVIEIKTAVTNSGNFATGFKARNTFTGPGEGPTGLDIAPTFAPTTSIGLARGFVSAAFFAPPPGVTITEAYGGDAVTIYSNTGGAVTNGTAFAINSPFAFGSLKPINQYGLHINNQGLAGTNTAYGLFVDAQSGSLNNYSAIFAGGNVGIGTNTPAYKLHVVDASNTGLRVQTNTAGGTVASFGGFGNFQIDAPGVAGGRLIVKEDGNVGIGTTAPGALLEVNRAANDSGKILRLGNLGTGFDFARSALTGALSIQGDQVGANNIVLAPTSGNVAIGTSAPGEKLTVGGTIQSTSGGFKFPDGSVQTTAAAGKTYTTFPFFSEVEIGAPGGTVSILHLDLPAGSYLVTASVQFENRGLFNKRLVGCQLINEAVWSFRIEGAGGAMDQMPVTLHTLITTNRVGGVDLYCGAIDGGLGHSNIFATARRFTAVTLGDVVTQP